MKYKILTILLTTGLISFTAFADDATPEAPAPSAEPDPVKAELTPQEMIKAIAAKNIFKPALVNIMPKKPQMGIYNISSGPEPLVRPFTLIGINITDTEAKAQLLFSNPVDRKAVIVGETIENLTITSIENTYIRCDYDGFDVKIDVGESSEDARKRILGFDKQYEFIGTTITEKEAFAYVKIGTELRRLEVGDALGESEIIRIEEGKLWIRHANGLEFAIDPTTLNTTTE